MEQHCAFETDVDADIVSRFAELSGDLNPLHTDPLYAARTEFRQPIAHGALLVGFVSRALGMYVPGRRCLILSLKARFPKPLYYPTRVRVEATLRDFQADRAVGTVLVTITCLRTSSVVAEAEVAFTLHTATGDDAPTPVVPIASKEVVRDQHNEMLGGSARVLVTGATGGLGREVAASLADFYSIVSISRHPEPRSGGVHDVQVDLEDDQAFDAALAALDPARFYAVLHMSVPPVRHGRVSDDIPDMRRQFRHAVEVPLLLARWARGAGSAVRRIVLIGSTAGAKFPSPRTGAYSLAKASMDFLPPLLAHDLAAQATTVNVVRPGFLPLGINKGALSRAVMSQGARVPSGVLPQAVDVAKLIAFLLSPDADHVNGATLTIDGGVLPL